MTYTLVVYDRAQGRLLEQQSFSMRADALRARFHAEHVHRGCELNIEVVVLAAQSREDLMRTHSRYFRTLRELAS